MWCFSERCHIRGYFANRTGKKFCWDALLVSSWRLSCERAWDVWLEQTLERTRDVYKESISNREWTALWHGSALLVLVRWHWHCPLLGTLWRWLIFDFIERCAPQNFRRCSGCFLKLQWTPANWQSLEVSSGFRASADSSGLGCWQWRLESPQRTTCKQVHVPRPISHLPPLWLWRSWSIKNPIVSRFGKIWAYNWLCLLTFTKKIQTKAVYTVRKFSQKKRVKEKAGSGLVLGFVCSTLS